MPGRFIWWAMLQKWLRLWLLGWLMLLPHLGVGALGTNQIGQAAQSTPQAEGGTKNARASSPAKGAEKVSFREMPREFLRDQAFFWLRPFRPKRADLPWAAAFLGTTAGLIAIDGHVAQNLSNSPPGAGYSFSHGAGTLGSPLVVAGVAGGFYVVGRWWGNGELQTTGLLGLRALADSLVIAEAVKNATQRPRPTFSGGLVRNHDADGQFFTGGRAFPSGHATAAWTVATVVARRHGSHRWVTPTVYGLASLVSFSRVPERRHFPSDIFVGAVLGYLVGRHVTRSVEGNSTLRWGPLRLEPNIAFTGSSAVNISLSLQLK